MLRFHVLGGHDLHNDDDSREVTVVTDDERPFVLYGEKAGEKAGEKTGEKADAKTGKKVDHIEGDKQGITKRSQDAINRATGKPAG